MSFPPDIPALSWSRAVRKFDQITTRVVSTGGNVNALAAAICLLLALKCFPTSSFPAFWWVQAAAMVVMLYCTIRYGFRAWEYLLHDYTDRCAIVDANDESKTIQGANSGIDDLQALKAAGMIGNPNERILGIKDGIPINAPSGTTFCKIVAKQGAGKTTGYVMTNTIHMANTVAHFTTEDDHKDAQIEPLGGGDWEDEIDEDELAAFDAAQSQPEFFDEFEMEGELFRDRG